MTRPFPTTIDSTAEAIYGIDLAGNCTLANRACLRLLRMGSGIPETPVDGAEVRLAHLRPEDIRIDLSRAIQSLPEHYREVILLRDIEEMSIDEIAGVLGLTRESAKARLHRARIMIREYLIRD